ncbi:phosphatase PAP2 family protein [Paraburkholderia sp. IW21]|uniref:phosphatase PAP2 family protein n=1 Tax=Paraburkholderia sp. IW21 TaxID=3242488 RepID=UPI003521F245
MVNFDTAVLAFLSRNAPQSILFHHVAGAIAGYNIFNGLLPITLLWGAWFKPTRRVEWAREMVVATLVSGFLALVVGRLLAYFMPFRLRPIYDPSVQHFFPFAGSTEGFLRTWSAFPSDHAVLWGSIAMGIFLIWRWAGVLAFFHCAVAICLPRIYLGLHYPTDILGGAAIGIVITFVMTRNAVRGRFAPGIVRLFNAHPTTCYMLAFLFCFELATMFDEPRLLAQSIAKVLLNG